MDRFQTHSFSINSLQLVLVFLTFWLAMRTTTWSSVVLRYVILYQSLTKCAQKYISPLLVYWHQVAVWPLHP